MEDWQAVLLLAMVIFERKLSTHLSFSLANASSVPLQFFTLVRMTHVLEMTSSESGAYSTFRHWFNVLSGSVQHPVSCAN